MVKIYWNSTIILHSSTIYTVLWYAIAEVVVKLFVKCLHIIQWKSATYWINHNVCLATFSIAWTHLFLAASPHYHSFGYSLPHSNVLLMPLDYGWPSYEPTPWLHWFLWQGVVDLYDRMIKSNYLYTHFF